MKIAYADCFSGISGDMFLGALLDCGLPQQVLLDGLAALELAGFSLKAEKKTVAGISATKCRISLEEQHHHRTWPIIREIINSSSLKKNIKEKSLAVFSTLARAEARVHGCSPEDVHFHEVGALDAIIDIVGAAIGLDFFNIEQLITSPLPLTRGWVDCAHGRLPLPAPAVCELVRNIPVYGLDLDQELVTPTGAALAKSLSASFGSFPAMTIEESGYGAGSHKLADSRPNLLRLIIGSQKDVAEAQEVEVIETHLDDWSPEGFPYLSELLFKARALDVTIMPIQMKKGRPGLLLKVICEPSRSWELQKIILTETTAIGLRYYRQKRWTLPRETVKIASPWGEVEIKKVDTPQGVAFYPEYEECRKIAKKHGIPLKVVYSELTRFSKK